MRPWVVVRSSRVPCSLGLTAGAGAVQVARAVAELGEVSGPPLRPVYRGWGVTLVALGRATDGPHHASTALIPFAIPRAGFRPPQALGMKNHFERAMESIDGAPSSGSILIGAASVPGARHLVPVGASGARHLPLHLSLSRASSVSLGSSSWCR